MTAANPNRGRPREREATRNVIIDAARRVAAREGIGAVSLSRVANEANFATGVVYGHFRSKNELLLSMVANDLSTMAHEMRETGWPDDEAGAQAALPLEEPVHEQIPNTIAEVAEEPAPQEDVEPFAGNAGLTAVARALQLPEEEITVAHEELAAPHEEIFSEVSYATEPLAEEVLESQPIIEEEILEHQPVEIAAETDVAFET
ncbi:MAG TPA: helix-turn-helix domain-containing protein, partial [Rhizomicrobium sp.]|nr:helix-turn-helix domain-containing protein [Rhizomicrobium sp.]